MPFKTKEARRDYMKKYRQREDQKEKNAEHQEAHRDREERAEARMFHLHAVLCISERIGGRKPNCCGQASWEEVQRRKDEVLAFREKLYADEEP